MRSVFIAAFFFLLAFANAYADGFDEHYEVLVGDSNVDGLYDLYIYQRPQVLILHGDIATPIKLASPVAEALLRNDGNGSFDLVTIMNLDTQTLESHGSNNPVCPFLGMLQ